MSDSPSSADRKPTVCNQNTTATDFNIPEEVEANGVDDLLAIWGPDRVLERIEAAFQSTPASQSYYYAQAGSLWRSASTREGITPVQLTNFLATITGAVIEDDGSELRRRFEIEASLPSGKKDRFAVSPSDFHNMLWPLEKIGPEAIVYPNQKDHARAAIQSLSRVLVTKTVYTHTGWGDIDGRWIYLHAGGAIGGRAR